jgi:sulfite reductase (NADPH) hemoprotein beta-component
MYRYDAYDQKLVDERVAEYRDQVTRFMDGRLGEDEFRPLRLKNGLYHQLHAYMLRVAIPYGLMTSTQLRMLAHIARKYDRGFGHFTTRQNIQYNWPLLEETPDILADLASVQMHAMQTSGNCVRNISADHLAGVAADEIEDPRPWCEIVRQYSTLHPEFSYLPRKFKIAFSGSPADRAATAVHDIGFRLTRDAHGRTRFIVIVGGGLGRTPLVGPVINDELEPRHLLTYTEAILRAYNLAGDRDNNFKARIKILVRDLGREKFRALVDAEHARILATSPALVLPDDEIERIKAHFVPPPWRTGLPTHPSAAHAADRDFARWLKHNTAPHKAPGYTVAFVSLKGRQLDGSTRPPGDITDVEMEQIAALADEHSFGLIRATHTQNLLLADVETRRLHELWTALRALGLANANVSTLQDIICCPGLDYCNLANAHSIPIAVQISERFEDLDYLHDLGDIKLKMSGCINSCGHHHVGHIGVLGVDMKGEKAYQILLGGSEEADATIGKWIGPAVAPDKVVSAIESIVGVYVKQRIEEERFLDTVRRIGLKPFAESVYA